jgi:hypothetical protein
LPLVPKAHRLRPAPRRNVWLLPSRRAFHSPAVVFAPAAYGPLRGQTRKHSAIARMMSGRSLGSTPRSEILNAHNLIKDIANTAPAETSPPRRSSPFMPTSVIPAEGPPCPVHSMVWHFTSTFLSNSVPTGGISAACLGAVSTFSVRSRLVNPLWAVLWSWPDTSASCLHCLWFSPRSRERLTWSGS